MQAPSQTQFLRCLRALVLGGLAGVLLSALPCRAAGAALIAVDDPWVRGTVEGQTGSGAYMRLTSSEDAQLVGASSPVAEHVEIHEMRTINDMMTMRRVERLALPAHTSVALDHDYHVMFIGLKHQLLTGQKVPITLRVLDAKGKLRTVQILAPVRALNTVNHPAGPSGPGASGGHGDGAAVTGSAPHG